MLLTPRAALLAAVFVTALYVWSVLRHERTVREAFYELGLAYTALLSGSFVDTRHELGWRELISQAAFMLSLAALYFWYRRFFGIVNKRIKKPS
jgi:hypothetical protein